MSCGRHFLILFVLVTQHSRTNGEHNKSATTTATGKRISEFRIALNGDPTPIVNQGRQLFQRWLQSRNLTGPAIRQRLIQALQSRQPSNTPNPSNINGVSKPYDQASELEIKYHDKTGNPVVAINIGDWNVRREALFGNLNKMVDNAMKKVESTIEKPTKQKIGPNNTAQWNFIVDFGGYNPKQHACPQCVQFYYGLLRNYENYHPGSIRNMFAGNVSRRLGAILGRVQSLFSPTMQKQNVTKIYSNNKTTWDFVDTVIPKNDLPAILMNRKQSKKLT